ESSKRKKKRNISRRNLHKKLVTTFPEESVAEAFEKMNKHNIGRLLVVSKENKETLLGILTRSDITHALRN
ncbi:MAG: CBS domain-containing protein, partial [Nitrososphaerales archaeon]